MLGDQQPPNPIDNPKDQEPSIDMDAFRAEIEKLVSARKRERIEMVKLERKLRQENKDMSDQDIRSMTSVEWGKRNDEWLNVVELAKIKNPRKNLTRADAIMWHNIHHYTKGKITKSQFKAYSANISRSGNKDRKLFLAAIINKIIPLWGSEKGF